MHHADMLAPVITQKAQEDGAARQPSVATSEEDVEGGEDDGDPFGDDKVISTPAIERGEPRW